MPRKKCKSCGRFVSNYVLPDLGECCADDEEDEEDDFEPFPMMVAYI